MGQGEGVLSQFKLRVGNGLLKSGTRQPHAGHWDEPANSKE